MATEKAYTVDSPDVLVDVEIPDKPVDPPADKPKEDVPADKPDDKPEGDKPDQDKGDAGKADADKPKDDKPKDDLEIGSWLDQKYGIKTKEELNKTLDTIDSMAQMNKKLEEDLLAEKAKKGEIEYESEDHKAAVEFMKGIPKDLQPESIITLGELRKIDIDNAAPKDLLRMKYILDHPELSREKVQYAFERYYEKYLTVDPEDYDNDEKRKKAEKDVEIDLEIKTAAAKKLIRDQKEKFKPKENKQPEPEKVSPEVERAVAQNAKSMEEFFSKNDKIAISVEGTDQKVTLALTEDMKKQLRDAAAWIKNPKRYKPDGKLEGFDSPQQLTERMLGFLYGPQMLKEAWSQATMIADKKKIEDLGKLQPDRSGKGDVDTSALKGMSIDDQNEKLIQERENKKKQQKR